MNRSSSATFRCATCGQVASSVVLLTAGERDPRLGSTTDEDALVDFDRLSIAGGPVSVTLTIGRSDVQMYCAEHYRHWDVYDGEFFDCVRGICPRGHERMLLD